MAKKSSPAKKLRYGAYKSDQRWKTNRIAKLEKHLELHPEDEIAIKALQSAKSATAPRRTGYKSNHPNRTSGQLFAQLKRLVRKAEKAAKFEQKKLLAETRK